MERKFYKLVWTVFRPLFRFLYPQRVTGQENLPAEGGFVLCANHCSALDPIIMVCCFPRNRWMSFLGKKELYEHKLLGPLVKNLCMIPVDRGNADLAAVRTCLKVLKEGSGLLIFPQGTRSKDNTRTPMLSGASMIALRAGTPVIPCYIDGPYRLFRRIDIRFGAPIDFSDFGRRCDADTLKLATQRIDDAVWALKDV